MKIIIGVFVNKLGCENAAGICDLVADGMLLAEEKIGNTRRIWDNTDIWTMLPDLDPNLPVKTLPTVRFFRNTGNQAGEALSIVLEGQAITPQAIRDALLYLDAFSPIGAGGSVSPIGLTLGWSDKLILGLLGINDGKDLTLASIQAAKAARWMIPLLLGVGAYVAYNEYDKRKKTGKKWTFFKK